MLNLKSVVFKIAVLPPQSCKFSSACSQCATQKNQQLVSEFKLCKTKLELFRRQNHWRLCSLRAHSNTGAGTSLPARTHRNSRGDRIRGTKLPSYGVAKRCRRDALDFGFCRSNQSPLATIARPQRLHLFKKDGTPPGQDPIFGTRTVCILRREVFERQFLAGIVLPQRLHRQLSHAVALRLVIDCQTKSVYCGQLAGILASMSLLRRSGLRRWREIPISRNIKRRPLLRYGVSGCNTTLTEKERLYESREVYRYGHSSGHHFRCRNGCERQADHGMPAGN